MTNHIDKDSLKRLLQGIGERFNASYHGHLGFHYIDLSSLTPHIWNFLQDESMSVEECLDRSEAEFEVRDFLAKYEISDYLIENLLHQRSHFDVEKTFSQLNPFAQQYVLDNGLLEWAKQNVDEATKLSYAHFRNKKKLESIKQRNKIGYVYVIKSEFGYKVGKTKNLPERSKIFNVKMPFEFHFVLAIKCYGYHDLETTFHKQYEHKHINGEWFNLSPEDIQDIKSILEEAEVEEES